MRRLLPLKTVQTSSKTPPPPQHTIEITDSPPKASKQPDPITITFSLKEDFLSLARERRGGGLASCPPRLSIRNTLLATLVELYLGDPSTAQPQTSGAKGDEEAFEFLLGLANSVEKALSARHPGDWTRGSAYSEHAKALLGFLRRPEGRDAGLKLLRGEEGPSELVARDPSSFVDPSVQQRLENEKQRFLFDRQTPGFVPLTLEDGSLPERN